MNIRRTKILILTFLLMTGTIQAGRINIVPRPAELKEGKGSFRITSATQVRTDPGNKELRQIAKLVVQKISMAGGPNLEIYEYTPGQKIKNAIVLTLTGSDTTLGKEGYTLEATTKRVVIRAPEAKGVFYGMQSLFQLLPPEVESGQSMLKDPQIPAVSIRDIPRYPYRGMHLDVCRHIFPVEFIKRYIDLMAMYKMNSFHWHLTDDQGWRIEIKKYPGLTQVGSVRPYSVKGKAWISDETPYGGFYTQEQIRDVVAYAASKYITVIPEIEMPGHAVAALAAYPSLSCTGGPFQVRSEWGVADDIFCAGNDSVFTFVEDVLKEVMALFPSAYIHIGGDEAPKVRWKACQKCQARIRAEGLKDEMELQSYFIKRVERFLKANGRRLIGWDEILEGGLAPEATVMSWRGVQGGIDAAKENHDVIMTPTDFCYFDYYQADPATEPETIGGMVTLKTVYGFEPTPPVLTPAQARHILGAQGNLWTEYIDSPSKAEYMAYPRAIALAEVNWSPKETRNWEDFLDRLDNQYKRLEYMGVNFSKGSLQVDITTMRDSVNHRNLVVISSETKGYDICYTLDGSEPGPGSTKYTEPFEVKGSSTVRACLVKDNEAKGQVNERRIEVNLATGKPVKVLKPYSFKYPGTGDQSMTDGLAGTASLKTGWQGYEGTDMEVVVDLLKPESVNRIGTTFIQLISSWVIYPIDVDFYTSIDGSNWEPAGNIHTEPLPSKSKADRDFVVEFSSRTARYVKVCARNNGVLPQWHEYKGQPCWIFADEIRVN